LRRRLGVDVGDAIASAAANAAAADADAFSRSSSESVLQRAVAVLGFVFLLKTSIASSTPILLFSATSILDFVFSKIEAF
jgi:hypothetical protein